MNKALTVAFISILMITGGTAFNFDQFSEDVTCNPLTSWLTAECPITDRTDFSASDSLEDTIYTDAVFTADTRERVTTELRSHLNQSYGLGMAEAKQETIKEFKNGTTQSNAYITAQTEINQLYGQLERRIIVNQNREVLEFNRSLKEVEESSGIDLTDVYALYENTPNPADNCDIGNHVETLGDIQIISKNVSLSNGDTKTAYGVKTEGYEINYDAQCSPTYNGTIINADLNADSSGNLVNDAGKILAKSPYDSKTSKFLEQSPYRSAWNEVEDTRQRAIENADQITTGIYNNYDQGDLKDVSVSELLGSLEILKTASTNYEDSGFYSYSAVSLAQQGLASNQSYAFEVNWTQQDSDQYKQAVGQLFVDKDDFNQIEAGKWYDATNKGVYMAYQPDNGDAKNIQITGEFKAVEITDKATGESINQTGVQSTQFYTTDITNLKNQLEGLREQIDTISGTSGGGGGLQGISNWFGSIASSLNVPRQLIEAVAVGVIVVLVAVIGLG